MSLWDVILTVVYFSLCYLIGLNIKSRNRNNLLYQKWFMKGLYVKLLGCLAFCLVYTYYYDYGGDTRGYYRDGLKVMSSLGDGLVVFWEVLQREYSNVSPEALDVLLRLMYKAPMEYYTVNMGSPFLILGLGSFFSSSLLIALFSYWGVWRFFQLFVEKFPRLEKQFAIAVLFIPSVVFWGSGLSKDTFILCFVGLFLFHINKLLNGKVFSLKRILIIVFSAYMIFVIKAYVIISLIPAVLIWRTLYLRDKISIGWLRSLVLPIFGAVTILVVVYALSILGQYSAKYSVDGFVNTAQSMQGWHYVEGQNSSENYGRGSSYTLGEYDPSPRGLLRVFPAAVNVTFFRPYLWEVKTAGMLAQAIESLVFLLITVYIFLKVGPIKFYRYISNDSFLLMCVVFSIFFGFAVGFSSYNFGALSRYKIQCVPFFAAALFIIHRKHKDYKLRKIQGIMDRRVSRGRQHAPGFTS